MPLHKQLTKDEVVEAAIELLAARGRDEFSVRQLADRLDVSATTVLWHTRSRDALLRDVTDRLVGDITLPDPDSVGPEDWLRLAATAIRRGLLERPLLLPLIRDLLPTTRAALDLVVAIAVAFERMGYTGDALRTAYDSYVGFVFGYNLLQHAQTSAPFSVEVGEDLATHQLELAEEVASGAIASLLRGDTPPGWGSPVEAMDVDYARGLEALLFGLRQLLAE